MDSVWLHRRHQVLVQGFELRNNVAEAGPLLGRIAPAAFHQIQQLAWTVPPNSGAESVDNLHRKCCGGRVRTERERTCSGFLLCKARMMEQTNNAVKVLVVEGNALVPDFGEHDAKAVHVDCTGVLLFVPEHLWGLRFVRE